MPGNKKKRYSKRVKKDYRKHIIVGSGFDKKKSDVVKYLMISVLALLVILTTIASLNFNEVKSWFAQPSSGGSTNVSVLKDVKAKAQYSFDSYRILEDDGEKVMSVVYQDELWGVNIYDNSIIINYGDTFDLLIGNKAYRCVAGTKTVQSEYYNIDLISTGNSSELTFTDFSKDSPLIEMDSETNDYGLKARIKYEGDGASYIRVKLNEVYLFNENDPPVILVDDNGLTVKGIFILDELTDVKIYDSSIEINAGDTFIICIENKAYQCVVGTEPNVITVQDDHYNIDVIGNSTEIDPETIEDLTAWNNNTVVAPDLAVALNFNGLYDSEQSALSSAEEYPVWVLGSDGYYYYKDLVVDDNENRQLVNKAVDSSDDPIPLFSSFSIAAETNPFQRGYTQLRLDVVVETVQLGRDFSDFRN